MTYRWAALDDSDPKSSFDISASANEANKSPSTPLRKNRGDSSVYSTPVTPQTSSDMDKSIVSPSQDLSDSLASLNISSTLDSSNLTSTPQHMQREQYPNLLTPKKSECDQKLPSLAVFAKISSQDTVFTVIGPSTEENSQEEEGSKAILEVTLDDIGGLSLQTEELRTRIVRGIKFFKALLLFPFLLVLTTKLKFLNFLIHEMMQQIFNFGKQVFV